MNSGTGMILLAEFLSGLEGVQARCGCYGDLEHIANRHGLRSVGIPKFCVRLAMGPEFESGASLDALVYAANAVSRKRGIALYVVPEVRALGKILGPLEWILLSFDHDPMAIFEFLIEVIPEYLGGDDVRIPTASEFSPDLLAALSDGEAERVRILENPNGLEAIPVGKIPALGHSLSNAFEAIMKRIREDRSLVQ